jgi:ubiquinone biosynthesis protein COQ9
MIPPPERSPQRDAAIEAVLPLVPLLGWTRDAIRQAAGPDADLLFPGGGAEMVEAYIDLADRRMAEGAEAAIAGQRLTKRVRTLIECRFAQAETHKDAVRRAARPARWMRSGSRPGTPAPISVGTPSARCWPESMHRPCYIG